MSELKPCPFCGEIVSLDYSELTNKKHWYITCDCCGMMYQAVGCQRKDTKTGWNTRPIEDALTARIAELEAENQNLNYFFHKLRMFCIFAHFDNPDTEFEFNKVDAEIREFLHEYKVCSDIERQDDKSSNDTQTQTIVYGKEDSEVQDV